MLSIVQLLVTAAVLALVCYTLYKVRAAHLMLYEVGGQVRSGTDDLFRQLEALQGLYVELGLTKSMPATRGWAASPDFLLETARHALASKPSAVLECSSGASTMVLARCMQMNGAGHVYSLEHDPHYAAQTRLLLERHGLSDWATVLDAPLTQRQIGDGSWLWYETEALPPLAFDMLAIDGPPQATGNLARYPAGPLLFPRLGSDAAVFMDDADRPDERAILARWKAEFPLFAQSSRQCEKGCAVLMAPHR